MTLFNPNDFIALLSSPLKGFLFIFLVITVISICIYRPVRQLWLNGNNLKGFIFIAEILTAVGLVGLLTFAGRTRLDYLDHEATISLAKAETAFTTANKELLMPICDNFKDRSPTLINASHEFVCAVAREISQGIAPTLYLGSFEHHLNEITDEKISEQHSKELIKQARIFEQSKVAKNKSLVDKYLLSYDSPWLFILFCFLIAASGISLKLVRSFIEWTVPAPSKLSPFQVDKK
ncbi:hypothetical protein [Limnobacter profundi]|uniref:DUF4239 domain-containing protein n=1 Tax=Limnobacter profundi TaxID=2732163 RepID=A0ABX6N464_9BURK|nr:hypothetical protein [Limnobacter sp. SAORIC-580]QJR29185.1 hypothetical protein HKT17_05410 [Limnobacter sp. SAORIC-580]